MHRNHHWLFTISKNTYFTYYKTQKKRSEEVFLENDIKATSEIDFTEQLLDKEQAFKIHKFLHTMQEPYKEVFNLRVFGELPFEKIGEIFSKSASWARVIYYRAKKQIIKYMEEIGYGKN